MNALAEAYEFEDFRVDALKRRLTKDTGELVPLAPKAFDTLLHLVRNPGKIIEKGELMESVWADTSVEENNLNQSISAIRRALGERKDEHRFVVTVPGRGYKFVTPVRVVSDVAGAEAVDALPTGLVTEPEVTPTPVMRDSRAPVWAIGIGLVLLTLLGGLTYLLTSRPADTTAGSIRTLTILPFKPLVAESRNEALELGMADTLIAKLSRGENIAVRPLESVRRSANADKDAITVARDLHTEAVLDGSIQTSGDRLRVTARLVRVSDGKQLWAGQFDERLTDIFSVQDSISERVASALQSTLRGKVQQAGSVEAYNLYLQGRYAAARLTREETEKAIDLYTRAIALDPGYALPYVGLSRAYRSFALTSDFPSTETMPKAKAAALKALELDETEPEAHAALGLIAFIYDWDWALAERHYSRALELDPNNSTAHAGYAHLLSNTGRHEQALAEARRARELNPLSAGGLAVEGQFLHYAGRADEAQERLLQTISMDPNFWLPHLFLSRVYDLKGMYAEAAASADRAWTLSRLNSESLASKGFALAKGGDTAGARKVLDELTNLSKSRYVPPYNFALVHASLSDTNDAIAMLEKAFEEKDVRMVFLKVDKRWEPLRQDPRFVELMRRMNFT